ncbi:MAG TPA: translation initiation factor IF-6 [Archaeoglobaceae archaeon]|nr:translation initiation factor IF-6 [Archaeoglobaceae archaeon]
MENLLRIRGIPLIGLYIRVTDEAAILGVNDSRVKSLLEELLDVDVVVTTIAGSELAGVLAAANSRGVIVSHYTLKREIKKLSRVFKTTVIETDMTCFGNIVCLNDNGGLVHPDANESLISKIEDALDVNLIPATIGGIKTVGMAACVTNKGGLLNPNSSDWEIKKVKKVLKIEPVTGTVNFGMDMVGTGLVANSKGYIAGEDTTGFELGIIEEALKSDEVVS